MLYSQQRLGTRSFPRRVSGIGEGVYVAELADFEQKQTCSKEEKYAFLSPSRNSLIAKYAQTRPCYKHSFAHASQVLSRVPTVSPVPHGCSEDTSHTYLALTRKRERKRAQMYDNVVHHL